MNQVRVGQVTVGGSPFTLIAGPCVVEGVSKAFDIAKFMKEACRDVGIPYIFKASFDKANRTSLNSYRGEAMTIACEAFARIRQELDVPVLTDIHRVGQAREVDNVVDAYQIPAFLCRQTDLLIDVARMGKPVNVKKGQFLAPPDMREVIKKIVVGGGNSQIMLTERGTCFGYNNLVVDFRSFAVMRMLDFPVIFDVTHSLQTPGSLGDRSGGDHSLIPIMAKAALATGCIDGLFMEVHPDPDRALCDGPNSLALEDVPKLLKHLIRVWKATREVKYEWSSENQAGHDARPYTDYGMRPFGNEPRRRCHSQVRSIRGNNARAESV